MITATYNSLLGIAPCVEGLRRLREALSAVGKTEHDSVDIAFALDHCTVQDVIYGLGGVDRRSTHMAGIVLGRMTCYLIDRASDGLENHAWRPEFIRLAKAMAEGKKREGMSAQLTQRICASPRDSLAEANYITAALLLINPKLPPHRRAAEASMQLCDAYDAKMGRESWAREAARQKAKLRGLL